MSFSSIGKFLPRLAKLPILEQVGIALALEAGTAFIATENQALKTRSRLVSIKKGTVHALTTSAPAKEELLGLKERLFSAMKAASPISISDLRVEVRGSLAEEA